MNTIRRPAANIIVVIASALTNLIVLEKHG